MNLHHIRYFLAVCETLNFTRAAERCNVTQPSLTRAIQNLECELGCRLFRRHRSGISVTASGEAVRRELLQVQEHLAIARAVAADRSRGHGALLRIGVAAGIGPSAVASFLGAFQAAHRDAVLRLSEMPGDALVQALARADLDAAVTAGGAHHAAARPGIRLFQQRIVVVLPRTHRLADLDQVPPGMLAGERLLVGSEVDVTSLLRSVGLEPLVVGYVPGPWLPSMVLAGAGIAVTAQGHALPSALIARPVRGPLGAFDVRLLTAETDQADAVVDELVAFAKSWPPSAPGQSASAGVVDSPVSATRVRRLSAPQAARPMAMPRAAEPRVAQGASGA